MAFSYTQTFDSFTIGASNTWTNYDIATNKSIPAGAVVGIICAHSVQDSEQYVGVRTDGSSLERRVQLHEGESSESEACYYGIHMFVKVAANGYIECYAQTSGETTFFIMEYMTGCDFTELNNTYSLSTGGTWENIDYYGSYGVPKGRVCEVWVAHNRPDGSLTRGIREDGSSVVRSQFIHESEDGGYGGHSYVVKTDTTNGYVEEYVSAGAQSYTYSMLLGYFDIGMDFSEDMQQINVTVADTWQEHDLSTYLDQDGRITWFLITHNHATWAAWNGGRDASTSTDRRIYMCECEDNLSVGWGMTVKTDSGGAVDLYADLSAQDWFFYTGYFVYTEQPKGAGGSIGNLMQALGML